jgi:hypothetical protein
MMKRVAGIIALSTAICLAAPKERAWQDARLLDTRDNPYFNPKDFGSAGPGLTQSQAYSEYTVSQNSSTSKVVYDHYVIEGRTSAYLVEMGRLKDYPAAHVILRKGLKFAAEKSKLWFIDEDGKEVETKILKEVARPGAAMISKVETPAPAPAPAPTPAPAPPPMVQPAAVTPPVTASAPAPTPKPAPPVVEARVQAPEPPPASQPVSQPVQQAALVATPQVVAAQEPPAEVKPLPMQESLVATTKPEIKAPPVVVKDPVVVKEKKPEPPKPEPKESKDQTASNSKDRPWQRGQLLSTASNPFFANVPYTTDSEASGWTFVQGADGKATVFMRAGASSSSYIYDNYVIDSDFCTYLIQRPRLKTVPPARFPGTKPLKFAIEKNKIWLTDEEGKEYEAKIVKTLQKDPDPTKPAGLSTASR